MCLQAQDIYDNDDSVGRVRRARGLRDDNGGVRRGRQIDDASGGSDTTMEAVVARRWPREIYDNDGGVGGGR